MKTCGDRPLLRPDDNIKTGYDAAGLTLHNGPEPSFNLVASHRVPNLFAYSKTYRETGLSMGRTETTTYFPK